MSTLLKTADVAKRLGCSPRKVQVLARQIGVGLLIGGRTGYRFEDSDVDALKTALRPAAPLIVEHEDDGLPRHLR